MIYPEISGNLNKSKYAKGILVTDFDGTLYRSNKTIGKNDLKTLYYLKEHGYLCVIATGRSLFSFTRATENMKLPIDYLIFSSGAGIQSFYDKKIIRALTHKTENVKKITKKLISLSLDFMIHHPIPDNHRFLYYSSGSKNEDYKRRCEMYNDFCEPFNGDIDKLNSASQLLAVEPPGKNRYSLIKEILPEYSVLRTTSPLDGSSTWIEIFPAGVTKSRGAAWLAEKMGLGPEETLAVGNDYNDSDLLEWAKTKFVVSNAPEELKEKYNSVSSNDKGGVTEAVKKWLEGK